MSNGSWIKLSVGWDEDERIATEQATKSAESDAAFDAAIGEFKYEKVIRIAIKKNIKYIIPFALFLKNKSVSSNISSYI
jgi:hypothetical protein